MSSQKFEGVIDDICGLNWRNLVEDDLVSVAWVYYYFSVQFRESLEIARKLYPEDDRLLELDDGERNTDNLSPWPGVAAAGERMNHDEFMRRTLELRKLPESRQRNLAVIGQAYLSKVRAMDRNRRAMALASYEDGGLGVANDPAMRDLVHISRLDVGTQMAAISVGLKHRGCYYLILSSYTSAALSRFGPGRAQLSELLRYAIQQRLQWFDFTVGDEPYKRDWSDTELALHDHLAAVTLRGCLFITMLAVFRRIKRHIKQSPGLWRAFSRARALAGVLNAR